MISVNVLIHTVSHLRPTQIWHQVLHRIYRPKYKETENRIDVRIKPLSVVPTPRPECKRNGVFTFLNIHEGFYGWNDSSKGMLWAYNLNYFDFINQVSGDNFESGCFWIDRFIADIPINKIGLNPYPTALRCLNWIKFFCRYPDSATKRRIDSLWSQYLHLRKNVEYHLLGNHLLEDFYALFVLSVFFQDMEGYRKITYSLKEQLDEQVLDDGCHFEQSPMYHCILLDRLLDSINFAQSFNAPTGDVALLSKYASRMLGFLQSICYRDGNFPMFNDSALEIAPEPAQIFDYAKRLGLEWTASDLGECGYRRMESDNMEATIDVGEFTATYQSGHSHADTFNFELRIDGKPFIIDTGISTYERTPRRYYERSTAAHNTVCVNGMDSSEVWDAFRVGKRCKVRIFKDTPDYISAVHYGYPKPCQREFSIIDGEFSIRDSYPEEAVSYLHIAPDADISRIKVYGASKIEIFDGKASQRYNILQDIKIMQIHFKGSCTIAIS